MEALGVIPRNERVILLLCTPKEEARKGTRHLPALRVPSAAQKNGRDVAASFRFSTCLGSQLIGDKVKGFFYHSTAQEALA
jgi:hypothetical protein